MSVQAKLSYRTVKLLEMGGLGFGRVNRHLENTIYTHSVFLYFLSVFSTRISADFINLQKPAEIFLAFFLIFRL